MKVELVHPPPYGEVPFKHLGLAYVASALRRYGLETRYLDLSERLHRLDRDFYNDLILRLSLRAGEMSDLPSLELLAEVLFPEHGDSELASTIRGLAEAAADDLSEANIVGIGYNTLTSYFTASLGRLLRARGIKVVIGGPLSRIDALTDLLLRLGVADAVLIGEGDLAAGPLFEAVSKGGDLSAIGSTAWLEGDSVERTPVMAEPILDALPWPELEGNILDGFVPISASRGCTRRCAYCSEVGLWPKGHRRRGASWVVAEMEHRSQETGLDDFHFHDDLLNGNRRFMEDFVSEVRGRGFTWESFFEPYRLDRPLLEKMKGAGCRLVKYGIQSFSPHVLRQMRRPTTLDSIIETVVATYELGISTHYDMLIGHPGETEADHQRNLELVEELYSKTGEKLYFSLNPFYLAAGSSLERDAESHGIQKRFADTASFPPPLADALAASPPYPIGYSSDPDRETIMRRMDELAQILARHDKDYLFLGKANLPPAGPRGRRMLPALDDEPRPITVSRRELAPRVFALSDQSNLRIRAELGRLKPEAPSDASIDTLKRALLRVESSERILVAGGEPTLSPTIAPLLGICRALGRPCTLETNGLRCGTPKYAAALRRHGLGHARVVLLGVREETASRLGGVNDALELALRGARNLIDNGVSVELGLLLSAENAEEAPTLARLAEERFPEVRRLVLLVAPIRGETDFEPISDDSLTSVIERLSKGVRRIGKLLVVDDRRLREA